MAQVPNHNNIIVYDVYMGKALEMWNQLTIRHFDHRCFLSKQLEGLQHLKTVLLTMSSHSRHQMRQGRISPLPSTLLTILHGARFVNRRKIRRRGHRVAITSQCSCIARSHTPRHHSRECRSYLNRFQTCYRVVYQRLKQVSSWCVSWLMHALSVDFIS